MLARNYKHNRLISEYIQFSAELLGINSVVDQIFKFNGQESISIAVTEVHCALSRKEISDHMLGV